MNFKLHDDQKKVPPWQEQQNDITDREVSIGFYSLHLHGMNETIERFCEI